MDFDAAVGNPPYQVLDGGGNGSSAMPVYQLFVQQAKKINPRYISMIIPARWYAGGKGLDGFREEMLHDERVLALHDFVNASDCFSGVEIKGGVCFFLWDRSYKGECTIYSHEGNNIVSEMKRPLLENCCETFIRYNDAVSILHKVLALKEASFAEIVFSARTFGYRTYFTDFDIKLDSANCDKKDLVLLYAKHSQGYMHRSSMTSGAEYIDKWKIFIPEAIGSGNMSTYTFKPILGAPGTACTETYIMNGPYESEEYAKNAISYIRTNFFHFMVGLKKNTQHTSKAVYQLVPMQDFSRPWTDEELYAKYGLSEEEIGFIESMIRAM